MQKLRFWAVAIGLVASATSCHYRGNRMVISDHDDHLELDYVGDIQFDDAETTIESISRDGYVEYYHKGDRMRARPDERAGVEIEMYEHGQEVSVGTEEGKRLMARIVRHMIELGFDAEGRMDRIYRKGGYPALLAETDSMRDDDVKRMYFERLLRTDTIPTGELATIVKKIGSTVSSDDDKKQLLSHVDTFYLKNDSVAGYYLDAVAGINGDDEKSQALDHFLRSPLSGQRYLRTLDVAKTISGDDERSDVLERVIGKGLIEGAPFDSLLAVIGGMNGDDEKSKLLRGISRSDVKESRSWAQLIRASGDINADDEKGNVLIAIAHRLPRTDSLKAVYAVAAKNVHSDEDYGRVMRAIEN
jgi:hypothetical protein